MMERDILGRLFQKGPTVQWSPVRTVVVMIFVNGLSHSAGRALTSDWFTNKFDNSCLWENI